MFSELCNETITVRKKDGTTNGPYQCILNNNKVTVFDAAIDVDDGDTIEREVPGNKVESYKVLEAAFSKGHFDIPDSWKLHVRKEGSLRSNSVRTTNIHIANASAIQIGDHNLQQVSSVLHSLMNAIEASTATTEQKSEAKARFAAFLKHPAVTATLGASAGALAKAFMGG